LSTVLVAATLLVVVAPGSPLPAQGQIYIPDNNTTTGGTNVYPFGTGTEWRYQILVNAQYLPSAPFKILDMAIVARSTATFTASQCQIRMCNTALVDFQATTNRNFDTNLCPCPTQVYNGPIKFAGTMNQWANLGLQCSHGYDGQRNLLIEVRFMTGSGNMRLGMTTVPASVRRLWRSGAGAYTSTSGSVDPTTVSGAPKLCLTIDRTCVLMCPDTVSLGASAPIQLGLAPGGDFYQMAASLGQSPLSIGRCTICLTPDPVFLLSVLVGPPIFNNYSGVVSAAGSATGKFVPPVIPQLIGICVYHAAVTYNRQGVTCCTNTCGTQITR